MSIFLVKFESLTTAYLIWSIRTFFDTIAELFQINMFPITKKTKPGSRATALVHIFWIILSLWCCILKGTWTLIIMELSFRIDTSYTGLPACEFGHVILPSLAIAAVNMISRKYTAVTPSNDLNFIANQSHALTVTLPCLKFRAFEMILPHDRMMLYLGWCLVSLLYNLNHRSYRYKSMLERRT